ncbi:hypothetical protein F6B41_05115 [Microbacterium lushaniae]|nr:hypothetical protein F6B41_09485 [Microbacterium lushaniae]KAA9157664.1 hypothetical protein F6B41_05115 [Microbacterium lushaniae]
MTDARSRIIRLRWASGLLIAQGTLMELSVFVGLVALLFLGTPQTTITDRVDIFALPYLNDNLYLMMAMSGIFGVLRVIGAIGLARNQMWGLVLSLFNCGTTLTLMVFLMPPGLIDGLLSGSALVLILTAQLSALVVAPTMTHPAAESIHPLDR